MKYQSFIAWVLTGSSALAIDLNSNGLSDIWEQRYGAQSLVATDDADGDGYSNAAESLAGTNPFLNTDFPKQEQLEVDSAGGPMVLTFPTKLGKWYQLQESQMLNNFSPAGPLLNGTGDMMNLMLEPDGASKRQNFIRHQLWSKVSAVEISDLDDHPGFPTSADGAASLDRFQVIPSRASGFAGRLQALITPPQTGDFHFYLSSGSVAHLLISPDTGESGMTTIARVNSDQTDVLVNSWDRYTNQKSEPVRLEAGQSYLIEVRYIATRPSSHCQVAWTGPGVSNEPQILSSAALVPIDFLPEEVPESPLLVRDYDAAGQTGTIWSSGTAIVSGDGAITGNSERFNADPTGSEDRVTFPEASTDHFYATWLFKMTIVDGEPTLSHDETTFYFRSSETSGQEGPRIDHRETGTDGDINSNRATVRLVQPDGETKIIDVTYGESYRVEIVASIVPGGFTYQAGLASYTVAEDTFDIYVSDLSGKLVEAHRGLVFRDVGADVVQKFDMLHASVVRQPNIVFDGFEITAGSIAGNGYLSPNIDGFTPDAERHFFRVNVTDGDQDNDGLTDWEEQALGKHMPYLFFDATTTAGMPDATAVDSLLSSIGTETIVTLAASDTAAFERNSINGTDDFGEITMTRTGPLTPLTVQLCVEPLASTGNTETICDGTCCSLVGSAGDEGAEVDDYQIFDLDGNLITNQVTFEFGEMTKILTVRATPDSEVEYPETLNLAVEADDAGSYQISETLNGASIQLFDLPDSPENLAIFTGAYGPEPGVTSGAAGSVTATLNGTRTELKLYSNFNNLTSAQQDSHIHKSNQIPGNSPAPGTIIFEITEEVEGETVIKNGPLDGHAWDLKTSSGAVPTTGGAASKQVIIDSLFGQNGESPLYLNIHTVDYPGGEIWALFSLAGGSQVDPGAPPVAAAAGSAEYPQLFGSELESEVRRFLNQATFGATDDQVAEMVSEIETERASNSSYHRSAAYSDWIDEQMVLQQSYHLDYAIATNWQHLELGGMYDTTRNPAAVVRDGDPAIPTPPRPAVWPTIDRSASDPEHWHLSLAYPATRNDYRLAGENDLDVEPGGSSQRHVLWQMMVNAKDQLRQKMGFSLQQIVVVSYESGTLDDQPFGMANYQDMLNTHAFSHYRDVFGYVNWSPIMGRWLSSLQNQKAADLDGDGENDIFPDENLAREDMQLFSIGLFERWPDGNLKLGPNGLPKSTYTNDDIREFAKVLTGQSFGRYNSRNDPWGGIPYSSQEVNDRFDRNQSEDGPLAAGYNYPMIMFGEFHDVSVKSFAGTTIDNTDIEDPTQQGIADIESAIDWLAGKPGDGQPDYDMVNSHRSTPAFICRRLIQRFTTSNPSTSYLHRVATVFKENEGDLSLTLRAILLDPEARIVDMNNTTFGLKRSPMESYMQILRSMEAFTYIPVKDPAGAAPFNEAPGSFANPNLYISNFGLPAPQLANQERNFRFLQRNAISDGSDGLQMNPMGQETVFNWYLSDYSPGGRIGEAGLVAPELQLANEQDVIRNINFIEDLVRRSTGVSSDALVENTNNQRRVFGVTDNSVDNNDRIRLDRSRLSSELYPQTAPTPVGGRSSESLADEILVDELDRRLTLGYFKRKYPYDPSDDEDPGQASGNDFLKNPRELIIDALAVYRDPYDGNNDENDRLLKLSDALYLLTMSPEFQIKK